MIFLKRFRGFAGLTLALITGIGCATKPTKPPCDTSNWYELGRQYGTQGDTVAPAKIVGPSCLENPNLEQRLHEFKNGQDYGLSEYCSYERGFTLAVSGEAVTADCPSSISREFSLGFENGNKFSRLDENERLIRLRVSQIDSELLDRSILEDRRRQLVKEKQKALAVGVEIRREMAKLTSDSGRETVPARLTK